MSRGKCNTGLYQSVLIKLSITLIFYSFSRLLFYLFNLHYFRDLDMAGTCLAFVAGLRFDLSALIILSSLFILMNTVPFPIRNKNWWQGTANIFLILFNSIGFGLNAIDSVYFRFTSKRMTADILSYIKTGEDDFLSLLPSFIADFIWEFLSWVLIAILFSWIILKVRLVKKPVKSYMRYYAFHVFCFLLAGTMAIIGIRGGLQLRPFTIIDAGRYTEAQYVSLVLNTPFTIIKSYGHTGLKEYSYFEDEAYMRSIYVPIHEAPDSIRHSDFENINVVVLIMESFSTEYIGALHGDSSMPSYTPNLDKLIADARAYRAYANGKQSIEALPAIVAGIPSLSTRPYITSAYGGNNINSLAKALGAMGYSTHFFHGGRNGTMGFESFVDIASYDHYYGKDEYDNDDDFDGNWGIYDEPYFSYFKGQLDGFEQPFFATFFSLSSHHPYVVPDKYKEKFNKGTLDIHESIMYADHCLGQFIESAKGTAWFNNTLFVITSDHTSLSYEKEYQSREGIYAIPLVFYMPGVLEPGVQPCIAQQSDIMPSVLGFLSYPEPFISFGNNLFDGHSPRFSINYLDDTYQLLKDDYALLFDGKRVVDISPLRLNGLNLPAKAAEQSKAVELEEFIKAYIQQYNQRLIMNRLTLDNDGK